MFLDIWDYEVPWGSANKTGHLRWNVDLHRGPDCGEVSLRIGLCLWDICKLVPHLFTHPFATLFFQIDKKIIDRLEHLAGIKMKMITGAGKDIYEMQF